MRRAWHHYQDWEDWQAGMYEPAGTGTPDRAAALLGDPDKFREIAAATVEAWPIAASQHLTDTGCNRRAWIGQASCCYALACTRTATIEGWFTLSLRDQGRANRVASDIIREWEWGWVHAETLLG